MPYTVAQIESILVRRCGRKLAYAHMDATTIDGTNADLSDPIAVGIGSLGYPVVDVSNVADADLGPVQPTDMSQVLAVAEWRCLESILGNRASPDQMADTNNEQWHGKFYDSLEKTVARKRKEIEQVYGVGLGTLEAGVYDLGFQETTDPGTGRAI